MKQTTLFILLYLPLFLSAQSPSDYAYHAEPCYEPGQTCEATVIAWSGLRLREKPDFKARSLAVIPYGEAVTYSSDESMKLFGVPYQYDTDSIPGHWQKVRWKGQAGYIFNAYLAGSVWKMDKPVYLLYEKVYGCWSDAYISRDYHYYGFYPNADTTMLIIKEQRPIFFTLPDEGMGNSNATFTFKQKQVSYFALATREPLTISSFRVKTSGKVLHGNPYTGIIPDSVKLTVPDSPWEIRVKMDDEKYPPTSDPAPRPYLRDKNTGAWHYLLPERNVWFSTLHLVWSGDFDGDGITDFMLAMGDDHYYQHLLFLSKDAGKWRFVRLAGRYGWEDCC